MDIDHDSTPDWGAELDQAVRGMRDLARAVHSYYEGLVEAGFTESQALRLAAWWVKPPSADDGGQ